MLLIVVVLVNQMCRIEEEEKKDDEHESLHKTRSGTVYLSQGARKFTYVDLRGTGKERFEGREISGLQSRHRFIRIGEIDPDRKRRR